MMTDIERQELEIKAPSVCCPMCDIKKCVGRLNCETLRRWVEKKLEELSAGHKSDL